MSHAPDPYLPERGDDRFDVRHYSLELDYTPATNRLQGLARIELVAATTLPEVVLDLAGLRVRGVQVDGRAGRWRRVGAKLRIPLTAQLAAGAGATVVVRYEGSPAPVPSPWGPVGWERLTDGATVAAQPSGACTWFPCNDAAAKKATFSVQVSVPAPYVAVANGRTGVTQRRASGTTWRYEQVEPTSPYLMALHVGRYRVEATGSPVPIRIVAEADHLPAARVAFARQREMLEAFERLFGAYPFAAGYAVVVCGDPLEIPLESQGQSIFGTNHLDGRHERLIAHELAHQWFGNSLTAATWSDVWLHEGFACYAEWLWSEVSGDRSAGELAAEHHRRLASLPQDLVLADPGPADLFDDRVYKRGALTLHRLRVELGDDGFFELLQGWAAENRHGLVTTAGFEAAANAVAGRPLDDLFDAWLREAALPPISA